MGQIVVQRQDMEQKEAERIADFANFSSQKVEREGQNEEENERDRDGDLENERRQQIESILNVKVRLSFVRPI